jgi:ATP synthase F1 delta subunit
MENLTVNEVYSQGLFDAAGEIGQAESLGEALKAVVSVLEMHPELFELLKTPVLPLEARRALARQVFDGRIPAEVLNFLYVLIDKRRIGQIRHILRAYDTLLDEKRAITKGVVYAAVPLSEAQVAGFERETGRLLKKTVQLACEIDTRLIGGVKIYVDGKLIDASIRGRLDSLKEQLL